MSGLARLTPAPRPAQPWRYAPAALQQWSIARIPEAPALPAPPLPAPLAHMVAQGQARFQTVAMPPPPPPVGPPPPLRTGPTPEEVAEANLAPLLVQIPAHVLPKAAKPVEGEAAKEAEACSICCEPLLPGEEVRRLPCFHLFHRACIDRWLRVKPTCPLDNQRLEDLLEGRQTRTPAPPAPVPVAFPPRVAPPLLPQAPMRMLGAQL